MKAQPHYLTIGIPHNELELQRAIDSARKRATRKSFMSAAGGALPIPGIDLLIDITLIKDVVEEINRHFGLTPEQIELLEAERKIQISNVLLKIAEKGVVHMVGRKATTEIVKAILVRLGVKSATKSAAKIVPILGQVVSASISFGLMRSMCELHIRDCVRVIRDAWELETINAPKNHEADAIEVDEVPPPLP